MEKLMTVFVLVILLAWLGIAALLLTTEWQLMSW
jgi:hypothetical protein